MRLIIEEVLGAKYRFFFHNVHTYPIPFAVFHGGASSRIPPWAENIDGVLGLRQRRLSEYLPASIRYESYILDENGKCGRVFLFENNRHL